MTALVRDPASLQASDGLMVVKGQPQDSADVEKAFSAVADDIPSAVIVTLNSARTSDNPFAKSTSPPTYMHDSHVNIIAAMKKYGIRKLVTLQAHGVGDSYPTLFVAVKLLVRYSNMAIGYKDHEQVEKTVKQSGLDYVLARPCRFVDGKAANINFYGDKGQGIGGMATITRESVAVFLLDAAEKDQWNGKTPVISN